ncbi:MAG: hypothetical protein WDO73_36555 [Ignavibacteriota bacterium]
MTAQVPPGLNAEYSSAQTLGGRNTDGLLQLGSGAALGSGRQVGLAKRAPGSGAGIGAGLGGGVGVGFQPAAVPQEMGDLFEYKLKDPISIAKNRPDLAAPRGSAAEWSLRDLPAFHRCRRHSDPPY